MLSFSDQIRPPGQHFPKRTPICWVEFLSKKTNTCLWWNANHRLLNLNYLASCVCSSEHVLSATPNDMTNDKQFQMYPALISPEPGQLSLWNSLTELHFACEIHCEQEFNGFRVKERKTAALILTCLNIIVALWLTFFVKTTCNRKKKIQLQKYEFKETDCICNEPWWELISHQQ